MPTSIEAPKIEEGRPPERTEREAALASLESGDHRAAAARLERMAGEDSSGESMALLGLAHFQREDYERAAQCYERALERSPNDREWLEMFEKARGNARSEISRPVPEPAYFNPERLLAPPVIAAGALPSEAVLKPARPSLPRRLGRLLGPAASAGLGALTLGWGCLAGYRRRGWTNWYRRRVALAILTLAYMRRRLHRKNLHDPYPAGALTGFQLRGQKPPAGVERFRTADGSWNNLSNPKEGAAGTRFARNIPLSAIRPESGARLLEPNPREVSRKLLARNGAMKEIPFLNLLAACWVQFQVHDWVSHGENLSREVHEIPLAEDDPARKRYRQTRMFVGKTQPDPTRRSGEPAPITFINEVTHWWDASQIYGSDQETQDRLRSFERGKLRLTADGCLPLDTDGVEDSGFRRNWWVGLAVLHTVFVREHNGICDRLGASYPDWDDCRLFNVARLINAAVMAKIHTLEWTPAVLPNPALNTAINANWYGYVTDGLAGRNRRTLPEFKIRNSELGGILGNPVERHGVPHALTEEFVEIYRLHSLLPESLRLRKFGAASAEEVPTAAARQAASPKLIAAFGVAGILDSLGSQNAGRLVLNNYPKFMQELSLPGNPLFDLGAVDILRARERGVPRYNEFRRQLGLTPIRSFEDLTEDEPTVARLRAVYGGRPENVEDLDLLIGTLAESHRPFGFGFGETLFQAFILNATRRLQTDRFFTDNYNEETYTPEGLEWIDRASLKQVLLRHYPELSSGGLANIANAFEPWDREEELDPLRHPLRAFDPA
jgi:tetratricopeptide (TPR) repeat protein